MGRIYLVCEQSLYVQLLNKYSELEFSSGFLQGVLRDLVFDSVDTVGFPCSLVSPDLKKQFYGTIIFVCSLTWKF